MPEAKTKLIDGESFTISQPYVAGHALTEAESKALNQTRSENIGNNMRSVVKAAKEKRDAGDSSDFDALASEIAKYDAEYTFAMGGSGPSARKLDPIEREARNIANLIIKDHLAKTGRKITVAPEGLSKEEWDAKIEEQRELLMTRDDVVKLAKKQVTDKQKVIAGGLEGLGLS